MTRTLTDETLAAHEPLRAGLDDESIEALFATTFRAAIKEEVR